MVLNLSELKLGESARVKSITEKSAIQRRLLDIGMISGTKVECVLVSPSSNPKAYMIRGAVIAIRNEDAKYIEIEV